MSTQEGAIILASAIQHQTRIAELSKLISQQLPDPETMERVLLRMKKLSLEDVIAKSTPIPTSHLFFFTANMIISKKYVADMCRAMIIHRHSDPPTGKEPEEWLGGKGEMPQPTWDAVLMALGVNTEEEESYDVYFEALICLEKLNYEPGCGVGPSEFVRRSYYLAAFQVLREIHRSFPSWNPFPFDYIEGAQNPRKDPVPVFNGTPKFKLPPKWPPFDESQQRGLGIILEEIRLREGTHTQVLTSEVLRLLLDKQLHPAEAMRTFLALLSNSPKQLWEICRLAPKGYLMHLIVTEDMLCKIAALITPGFVTYYMNSGAESMMKAVYYARYRRPGTLPLDIYYHLKAAEEPLYCFTGAKAIVMTCEGAVHVRIGRKVYDATIFELPSGWYPAFLTEFSNQYQVPSNIPVSPTGEYFFTYLTWKMKLAHPISNIEVRLYEAWWAEQNPPEQVKIIEEMKEHGKQPPIRCMKFMEATLREKAYIIRYCLRKIPMQVIDDFIENDIFCREWAEQLGIIPDELREPRFGDQLMPRSGFDCDGWEAEAAKLPESFPITPLPFERKAACAIHPQGPLPSHMTGTTHPMVSASERKAAAPQRAQPTQPTMDDLEPYRVNISDPHAREKIAAKTGVTDFSQLEMVADPRINGYWIASRAEWDKLHKELEEEKKSTPAASTAPKTPTTPTASAPTGTPNTTTGLTGLTANQKKKAQKKASAAKKKAAAQEAATKEASSTAQPAKPTTTAQSTTKPVAPENVTASKASESQKLASQPAIKPAPKPVTKATEPEDEPKTTFLDMCPPEGPFAEVLKPDPRMCRYFPTQVEVEVQYNKLMAILARVKSEVPDVLTHEQSLARIAIHNGIDVVITGANVPEFDAFNDPARREGPTAKERKTSSKEQESLYEGFILGGDSDEERIVAGKRPGAPKKKPNFSGLPKRQVPVMDSYGMYGICPETQQEYISPGEWAISEGAGIYNSMLKERGVAVKEEPKKEDWVLIKSKTEKETKTIEDRVLALTKEFSKTLLLPKKTEDADELNDDGDNECTEDLGDFAKYAGTDDYACYAGSIEDAGDSGDSGNVDSDNAGSTGSADNLDSEVDANVENVVGYPHSHADCSDSDADSLKVSPDAEDYQLSSDDDIFTTASEGDNREKMENKVGNAETTESKKKKNKDALCVLV